MTMKRITFLNAGVLALLACIASCGGGGYGGGSSGGGAVTYTVGGTLSGATGPVTLKLNGANDLVLSTPGNFTFTAGLAYLATYTVTATSTTQTCTVTSGAGTMGFANITNVAVGCV
jgi:hypothetical protein